MNVASRRSPQDTQFLVDYSPAMLDLIEPCVFPPLGPDQRDSTDEALVMSVNSGMADKRVSLHAARVRIGRHWTASSSSAGWYSKEA